MKKVAALTVLALASLALVACGSSDSSTTEAETGGASEAPAEAGGGGEAAGSVVQVATPAGTDLAFTADQASTEAGKVTVEFDNAQELKHDVAVEDSKGDVLGQTELIAQGNAVTTVDLKPGEYTYFCTVPGHREAGMEGTLTVK
jgi:plastocyanin